jgi:hypothetical protein
MKATKPVRVLPPEGQHIARVYSIVYLGTIKGQFGDTFKMRISWELPTELHSFKEGEPQKPFVISKETSLSMGKKSNLLPIVEGIIGTHLDETEAYNFDFDELVGMTCQIHIVYEEKGDATYANVKSVSPLLKGVVCPPAFNKPVLLSYEKWNQETFESLPEFLRKKIIETPEYKKLKGEKTEEIDPNDIPFD